MCSDRRQHDGANSVLTNCHYSQMSLGDPPHLSVTLLHFQALKALNIRKWSDIEKESWTYSPHIHHPPDGYTLRGVACPYMPA